MNTVIDMEREITNEPAVERKLVVKDKNYKAPARSVIDSELMKVSNFTEDEMAILGWSSKYKAHSLIVKYGESGVEEEFRALDWFKQAVAEYIDKKAKGLVGQKEEDLSGLDEKEIKKREKEAKRKEREAEKQDREAERSRKERVKELKKKFDENAREFSINEFYGFLKELGMSKDKNFQLTLIDKAYIQVKRNEKLYFNLFIQDDGKIVYKRGELK